MLAMALRLRQARVSASLSQAQLASQVGIQRSAVAQWERTDGTLPKLQHLVQVALFTGVSFEWLATGRGTRRLDTAEADAAVILRDFAQDELETRTLELMRCLPRSKRHLACSILELLGT